MKISRMSDRFSRLGYIAVFCGGTLLAGCSVSNQEAPPLSGPSGFGLSLTLTASPDVLPRDGVSVSTIRAVARGPQGEPLSGKRLVLSTSAGTLSASEVTTASNGEATFALAPLPLNQELSEVVVAATAVGTDSASSITRNVTITVVGPAPGVSFSVNPESPRQLQLTTLAATALFNGTLCGNECGYTWKIDSEAMLSGRNVVYRFQQPRAYVVTLTVTAPSGATGTTSKVVTVRPPDTEDVPEAVIAFSPSSPTVADTIRFDGLSSKAAADAVIVRYVWDFGDGNIPEEGAQVSHKYAAAQTYTVRLTVYDSGGRTGTITKTVIVAP